LSASECCSALHFQWPFDGVYNTVPQATLISSCVQVLDNFMSEVGQRFTSRTEERLLAVVYTLQQRTYKTGLPAGAPVPEVFKKELAGKEWLLRDVHAQQHVQTAFSVEPVMNLKVALSCVLDAHVLDAPFHTALCPVTAGVCKACGSRDATSGGRLAHFQQQFAKDLDPSSSKAPQNLGEMTDRLKVGVRLLP
jgi:hypothetical protein